jgi:uroporphyrinogen-III synthase
MVKDADTQGVVLDVVPFICTVPFINEKSILRLTELYKTEATVVFTSANAVEAITTGKPAQLSRWKIYCIGNATKNAVSGYFDKGTIAGTADDAGQLAKVIIERGVQQVVFFCGNKRMDTLPEVLKRSGVQVEEIIVYKTEETPQVVNEEYEGILFFSPSGVDSFFSKNKVPGHTVLFAIGNTTAKALALHSDNELVTGDIPSKKVLISKAIDYLKKGNNHNSNE